VPADELVAPRVRAAADLQRTRPIAGFRPGRAPLDAAERAYGAMAILEAAAKYAVAAALAEVVARERFATIGEPEVTVTKLAPGEPLEFTANLVLLPTVTLGDYRSVREPRQAVTVTDQEVADLMAELRAMRAAQVLDDAPAARHHRVVVDLTLSRGGVPVEGGRARGHAIDLFKPYFIAGFTDALIGLRAGERKTFALPFPDSHYNRALAGKLVDVAVEVRGVYRFEPPPLDDSFAAALGRFATLAELRAQLNRNLVEMKTADEEARLERAIIDRLIAGATFGDIPEQLVAAELEKIAAATQGRIERDGGSWEDYLAHLKTTPAELRRGWRPEAMQRVKAALLVRAIADAESLQVSPREVAAEQAAELAHYPAGDETRRAIESDEYARHLKHVLLTRKVMELLKGIATKAASPT
jgi:trigger factor